MATIKSYADLQQSKKLAEILPLESADMCWTNHYYGPLRSSIAISAKSIDEYKNLLKNFADLTEIDVFYPAWSLAGLLDVLPQFIKFKGDKYYLRFMKDYVEYANDEISITGRCLHTIGNNNLIDACVDMILKLHESNLL